MKLYFLRHGHAEPGMNDHARRLTADGIHQMQTAAQVIKRLDIHPLYIYASPRTRAQQTAEIVAKALDMPVQTREEVNFNFDVNAVATLIEGLRDDDDVMFVGHEPTFSMTIQELTGGKIAMKKGGLVRVDLFERQPLRGVLTWVIAPKVFASLV